jgi:hypothetical protein
MDGRNSDPILIGYTRQGMPVCQCGSDRKYVALTKFSGASRPFPAPTVGNSVIISESLLCGHFFHNFISFAMGGNIIAQTKGG